MLMKMSNELTNAIWVRPQGMDAGACGKLQAALFRLELTVSDDVESAVMHITAADRYRLYVNGENLAPAILNCAIGITSH